MRILRWKTLLGRRLSGESIAPLMLAVVLLLCVLLSLVGTVVDLGLDHLDWIAGAAEALGVPVAVVQIFLHARHKMARIVIRMTPDLNSG